MNEDLVGEPELVNQDAYGSWFIRVKLDNPSELDKLLNAEDYKKTL